MTAQPQDHQSADFTFEFVGGGTITLPRFNKVMSFGRARRLRQYDEAEQMFRLIEEICDEGQLALLDEMDTDETGAFFDAWQADSGVSVGESEGSST